MDSKILIVKKGITEFNTECIVNAANENLFYGGGVCGAIFRTAGVSELSKACDAIGYCKTGDAVITPAFNLKNNKYIIHAVGPIYSESQVERCRDELNSAYIKSLELMVKNDCHSITFPLISSGIYGYPKEEAWRIAVKACYEFIESHNDEEYTIYFAVIDDETYDLGFRILGEKLKEKM